MMAAVSLDVTEILYDVYSLADMIVSSQEMRDYLYWKQRLSEDDEAQRYVRLLNRKKEEFEDVQRFGHFHPDYHEKKMEIEKLVDEMNQVTAVARFKSAEDRLDKLLYHVSRTIARSVSHTIKVPRNNDEELAGCGSGGCSSGNCGSGG
jgi:cell fate (sporulation/competence/biofilm development) regulator YlbF (YheA/YmcA/DUF963 family)